MRSDCRYVVKKEHTLGYIFDGVPHFMGVLASNKDGHNPNSGSVCYFQDEIRPATRDDFSRFRVVVPPDFT